MSPVSGQASHFLLVSGSILRRAGTLTGGMPAVSLGFRRPLSGTCPRDLSPGSCCSRRPTLKSAQGFRATYLVGTVYHVAQITPPDRSEPGTEVRLKGTVSLLVCDELSCEPPRDRRLAFPSLSTRMSLARRTKLMRSIRCWMTVRCGASLANDCLPGRRQCCHRSHHSRWGRAPGIWALFLPERAESGSRRQRGAGNSLSMGTR